MRPWLAFLLIYPGIPFCFNQVLFTTKPVKGGYYRVRKMPKWRAEDKELVIDIPLFVAAELYDSGACPSSVIALPITAPSPLALLLLLQASFLRDSILKRDR
ncbi:hypothetical protein EDB85DRAFT_968980 [Lactarius pseudohatsudake]|nr:hypothetical protein EDB85DRAFT_968980 [Lactarius pseudohatsudake]